jgi:hypothetical protein
MWASFSNWWIPTYYTNCITQTCKLTWADAVWFASHNRDKLALPGPPTLVTTLWTLTPALSTNPCANELIQILITIHVRGLTSVSKRIRYYKLDAVLGNLAMIYSCLSIYEARLLRNVCQFLWYQVRITIVFVYFDTIVLCMDHSATIDVWVDLLESKTAQ